MVWILEHKCSVLNIVKVSDTKSHLVCAICKKVVGTSQVHLPMPKNANYLTDEERDSLI